MLLVCTKGQDAWSLLRSRATVVLLVRGFARSSEYLSNLKILRGGRLLFLQNFPPWKRVVMPAFPHALYAFDGLSSYVDDASARRARMR